MITPQTKTANVLIGSAFKHRFDGDTQRIMEITDIEDIEDPGMFPQKGLVKAQDKTFMVLKGRSGSWYISEEIEKL